MVTVSLRLRRFLVRRYGDLYGDEEPRYQDPPELPNLAEPSGGVS